LVVGAKKVFSSTQLLENTKANISIFNLNGGASIWWEDLKEFKGLKESKLIWNNLRIISERITYHRSTLMEILRSSMSVSWGKLP